WRGELGERRNTRSRGHPPRHGVFAVPAVRPTAMLPLKTAKLQASIAHRRESMAPSRGGALPVPRAPPPPPAGLAGKLKIVDFAQFVFHLEKRLDDVLDLERHAVQFLERDPFQLAAYLLVEVEEATEPTGRHEAPVHVLVGGHDPLQAVSDVLSSSPGFVATHTNSAP